MFRYFYFVDFPFLDLWVEILEIEMNNEFMGLLVHLGIVETFFFDSIISLPFVLIGIVVCLVDYDLIFRNFEMFFLNGV